MHNKIEDEPECLAVKRPYRRPELQIFGKVSDLTHGHGGSHLDSGNHTGDRPLKERVVRIGTHPLGVGLYLFDYKAAYRDACGHGRQFGVMADEIEAVMLEAVLINPNDYKRATYAKLGIQQASH